jgi:hypothetical protein
MTKISKKIPVVSKKLEHPLTLKKASYVWIDGKGGYRWNSAYKVYNNIDNYAQLLQSEVTKINWYKSE